MRNFDSWYTAAFAIIISINVGCGLCISGAAAFFNDGGGNAWAFIIFGIYALFSTWMIFCVVEVYVNKGGSSSLKWISGASSVITIGMVGTVFYLVRPTSSGVIIVAIVIAGINLIVLSGVASCYTDFLRLGIGERWLARHGRLDAEKAFPVSGVTGNENEAVGQETFGTHQTVGDSMQISR